MCCATGSWRRPTRSAGVATGLTQQQADRATAAAALAHDLATHQPIMNLDRLPTPSEVAGWYHYVYYVPPDNKQHIVANWKVRFQDTRAVDEAAERLRYQLRKTTHVHIKDAAMAADTVLRFLGLPDLVNFDDDGNFVWAKAKKSSRFLGVSWDRQRGKWQCQYNAAPICTTQKLVKCQRHVLEIDAAFAFDTAVITNGLHRLGSRYHGLLNFNYDESTSPWTVLYAHDAHGEPVAYAERVQPV